MRSESAGSSLKNQCRKCVGKSLDPNYILDHLTISSWPVVGLKRRLAIHRVDAIALSTQRVGIPGSSGHTVLHAVRMCADSARDHRTRDTDYYRVTRLGDPRSCSVASNTLVLRCRSPSRQLPIRLDGLGPADRVRACGGVDPHMNGSIRLRHGAGGYSRGRGGAPQRQSPIL